MKDKRQKPTGSDRAKLVQWLKDRKLSPSLANQIGDSKFTREEILSEAIKVIGRKR